MTSWTAPSLFAIRSIDRVAIAEKPVCIGVGGSEAVCLATYDANSVDVGDCSFMMDRGVITRTYPPAHPPIVSELGYLLCKDQCFASRIGGVRPFILGFAADSLPRVVVHLGWFGRTPPSDKLEDFAA